MKYSVTLNIECTSTERCGLILDIIRVSNLHNEHPLLNILHTCSDNILFALVKLELSGVHQMGRLA